MCFIDGSEQRLPAFQKIDVPSWSEQEQSVIPS